MKVAGPAKRPAMRLRVSGGWVFVTSHAQCRYEQRQGKPLGPDSLADATMRRRKPKWLGRHRRVHNHLDGWLVLPSERVAFPIVRDPHGRPHAVSCLTP